MGRPGRFRSLPASALPHQQPSSLLEGVVVACVRGNGIEAHGDAKQAAVSCCPGEGSAITGGVVLDEGFPQDSRDAAGVSVSATVLFEVVGEAVVGVGRQVQTGHDGVGSG